ncbi:rhomboid family intramembrane serine protease [Planctomycetota bacterium]|nr:rhomboid family intramembrane serine protease [Planctomycetota bacterium]
MAQRDDSTALGATIGWLALLWLIFALEVVASVAFKIQLAEWGGVRPHNWWGLTGIVGAHFLHADLGHLIANTIGLGILGLVASSYSRSLTAVAVVTAGVFAGVFAWIFGSAGQVHIGASGIVFGLIGFLLFNGLFRKGCLALVIAVAVLLLFGGALYGVLPSHDSDPPISWQMHLGGFIGGALASWRTRKERA